MSELSKSGTAYDEGAEDHGESLSPWSMLCTMLLLIIGLLFSSMLLINQTLKAQAASGDLAFQSAQLVEWVRALFEHETTPATANAATKQEEKPTAFENIKQAVIQTPPEKVRRPRLRLTGFGTSSVGSEAFAIINGELTHPGEFSGKVQLVEVRNHDVVVEYKGEQKILTVELED